MMIKPITAENLKSIPASIPASTPLKPSFRGNDEGDTVEISGETEQTQDAPAAEQKKPKITAEDIRKKSEEFSESVDAFAENIDKTTDSVTNAATKTTGAFTLIGGAFAKLIPAPIKDFFATPVVKQVKNEAGKMIDVLDESGHKVYETIKGSDGVERVVRKFNKKHTIIAAAVAAGIGLTIGLVKHFKNKAKKAQKTQQA